MTERENETGDAVVAKSSLSLMNRRRVIASAAALAALSRVGVAASPVGRVERAEGSAFVDRDGRQPLAPPAPVHLGDAVGTSAASRMALSLLGDTLVLMGPETRLTIDQYTAEAGGVLVLGEGAMLFDRPPEAQHAPVSVFTTYGVIAVRGTRFFAGPSRGAFGLFVARGVVEISAGGRVARLTEGLGVDIARRGAAPTTPRAWGAARIAEALTLVGA